MSEADTQQQDGQKTIVSFIVGLLIGGLLVWVFSAPTADNEEVAVEDDTTIEDVVDTDGDNGRDSGTVSASDSNNAAETTPAPAVLEVGDGSVNVSDQPAGMSVALNGAVFPVSEGWIGVRIYNDGNLTNLLGVVRFSESDGLVPDVITLQAPTTPGFDYAIVMYTEDGDKNFSLAGDVQIDEIFATFTAQ